MSLYSLLWFLLANITLHVFVHCAGDVANWINVATLAKSYFNISTSNVLRCEKICQRQKQCVAASFDIVQKVCFLHNQGFGAIKASGHYMTLNVSNNIQSEKFPCNDTELLLPSTYGVSGRCVPITCAQEPDFCPGDFDSQTMPNVCFKTIDRTGLDHIAANTTCKSYSKLNHVGHLLTVSTKEMYNILSTLISSGNYHVDGHKRLNEKEWKDWKADKMPLTIWANGEPNNERFDPDPEQEQCVMISRVGQLIDIPCFGYSTGITGVLCQISPQ